MRQPTVYTVHSQGPKILRHLGLKMHKMKNRRYKTLHKRVAPEISHIYRVEGWTLKRGVTSQLIMPVMDIIELLAENSPL